MLKINAFKIVLLTSNGEYGFSCAFTDSLNIIKGRNSSGKSTLLNSLFYSLGMEELLGAKNESVLPYAVKDKLETPDGVINIISSKVLIEIQNKKHETITLQRAIKSESKSNKLIEIIKGAYLTSPTQSLTIEPKFLHDAGSAQKDEGFYKFLERFLDIELPIVPLAKGGEAKLYIQTLFAALFIEQKKGWTDYVANIPYFGIRNASQKVIEYLLGFEVFETDRHRNLLDSERAKIDSDWNTEVFKIKMLQDRYNLRVIGIPLKPTDDFDKNLTAIEKYNNSEFIDINKYISDIFNKINSFEEKKKSIKKSIYKDSMPEANKVIEEISRLSIIYETLSFEIRQNQQTKNEYNSLKIGIIEDIDKNKVAKKIRELGSELDISIAKDICPTCHQAIDDSLLLAETLIQPMTINENLKYLISQKDMLEKTIKGIDSLITRQNRQLQQVDNEIKQNRDILKSLKKDISNVTGEISEAELRKNIQNEDEIVNLNKAVCEINEILQGIEILKLLLKEYLKKRASLPKEYLSKNDKDKILNFQKKFKILAKKFGYRSSDIDSIEINEEKYTPFLSGETIKREIKSSADIKNDSSASDFVRLIWAYLISLHHISATQGGNHQGILIFDEPQQHSMDVNSVHNLLDILQNINNLQSIVAASFDGDSEVFKKETKDIRFHLIELEDKLLRKITSE
jgi:hypothetical protein